MKWKYAASAWTILVLSFFFLVTNFPPPCLASTFDPESIVNDPAIKRELAKLNSDSASESFFMKRLQNILDLKDTVEFCEELWEGAFTKQIEKIMNVPVQRLNISGWGRYDIIQVKQIVQANRKNPFIRQLKEKGKILGTALSLYSLYGDIKKGIEGEDGAKLRAIIGAYQFSQGYIMGKLGIGTSGTALVGAQIITYSLQRFIEEANAQYSDYWWTAYMQYLEIKYPLMSGKDSWVELAKTQGQDGINRRLYEFWDKPYENAAIYYGKSRIQSGSALADSTLRDSYAASYYVNFIYPTLKVYFQKEAERQEAEAYIRARELHDYLMHLKQQAGLLKRALHQLKAQEEKEEAKNEQEESESSRDTTNGNRTDEASTGSTGSQEDNAGQPGTSNTNVTRAGSTGQTGAGQTPPSASERDLALQNANCSQWPGSVPVWNEQTRQVECICPAGTQWNEDSTRCISLREAALEQADCSQWPGSVPVWNDEQGRVECNCPSGTQWNSDSTRCIDSQQAAVENLDCSQWPGSIAIWNQETQQAECSCPSGTQWNSGHTECIDSREAALQSADCSQWPGSVPVWNEQESRVECDCPGGFQWNEDATRCINTQEQTAEAADCSQWPGTVAVWNPQSNRYECSCPPGSQWDQTEARCMSGQENQGANTTASTDNCGTWDSAIMGQLNSGNIDGAWNLYFDAQSRGCVPSEAVTTALRNAGQQQVTPNQQTSLTQQTNVQGIRPPYGGQQQYYGQGQQYPGSRQNYGQGQGSPGTQRYSGGQRTGSQNFTNNMQSLMNMLGQGGRGNSSRGRGPGAQYFMNQLQTLMNTTGQRSNAGSQNSINQFQNFLDSLRRMNQGAGTNRTNPPRNQGSLSNFFNTFNNSSQYQNHLNQFLRNDPNYQRQQNYRGLSIRRNTSIPQNNVQNNTRTSNTTRNTSRNNTRTTTQGTNRQNGSGFNGDMSLFGITADPVIETGRGR